MSSSSSDILRSEIDRWSSISVPQQLPNNTATSSAYIPTRPWELESTRTFPASPSSNTAANGNANVEYTLFRDTFYWCPYCQRVQLQLELKQIPYRIQKINMNCYGPKPPEFLAKVPSGLLPVLQVNNNKNSNKKPITITESIDIMLFLEENSPAETCLLSAQTGTALSSASQNEINAFAQKCLQAERALAGAWLNFLRGNGGRNFGGRAEQSFFQSIDSIEKCLSQYPSSAWFLGGERPSLVECVFAPFMERVEASMLYFRSVAIRDECKWPLLYKWMQSMDDVAAYKNSKSDIRTHARALPPQIGRCMVAPSAKQIAGIVESSPSQSVVGRVSSKPAYAVALEATRSVRGEQVVDWSTPSKEDVDEARVEAARALWSNWSAVVRDAVARGALMAGGREEERMVEKGVGAAFRAVARVLLAVESDGEKERVVGGRGDVGMEKYWCSDGDVLAMLKERHDVAKKVEAALVYACGRVCTPRDMRILAGDQYQGAINAVVAQMQDALKPQRAQ